MPTYGIDATSAAKDQKTGVEWYAFDLIQAMKHEPLREGERVVLYSRDPLPAPLSDLPAGWTSKVLGWGPKRGWMKLRMAWEMMLHAPNVLFVPAQGLPMLHGRARIAATVHDVEFLRVPALFPASTKRRLTKTTKSIARKARQIFAVSQTTKEAFCRAYKVPAERVFVTYLAPSTTLRSAHPGAHRPFFLFAGRIESRKNLQMLLRAFASFKRRRGIGDPYELILVGKDGFGANEIRSLAVGLGIAPLVRFVGYLPPEELEQKMSEATAFLFPSAAEGFGMPILEAMRLGTPVLASSIPAHGEIAGGAAMLIPVEDTEAWASALTRITAEPPLRADLATRGSARAAQFSWEATARATWDGLRNMLG